jgi:Alginate export
VKLLAVAVLTSLLALNGSVARAQDDSPATLPALKPLSIDPADSILSEYVPQGNVDPQPPPYTLVRFNEDYKYLADPRNRTDLLDPLKYIPLNKSDPYSYLSFGGSVRERYDQFDHPNFGTGPVQYNNYVLQQITLYSDLHVNQHVRFFVEGISGLQFGGEGVKAPVDVDPADLQQAFVDIAIGDPEAHDLRITARGGRFEMTFGSGRLVATRAAPNIPFKYDGGELIIAKEKSRLYVFATRPVMENKYEFDGANNQQAFWGIYGTTFLGGSLNTGIDLYYLGLRSEDAQFADGVATEERHTLGTRIFGKANGFDYDIEPVLQIGTFGDKDIRAWTIASDVGYTFQSVPWKPRIGNKADIASGDTKRGDGTLGTFNPLFFKSGYFNDASIIRPSNIMDIHPSLQFRPVDPVQVTLASDVLWRYSSNDAVYAPPGFIELPAGSSSPFIGTTAEAAVQWTINRHWALTASYTHLFASDAVRNQNGHDVDYLGTWLTFVW